MTEYFLNLFLEKILVQIEKKTTNHFSLVWRYSLQTFCIRLILTILKFQFVFWRPFWHCKKPFDIRYRQCKCKSQFDFWVRSMHIEVLHPSMHFDIHYFLLYAFEWSRCMIWSYGKVRIFWEGHKKLDEISQLHWYK